MNERVLISINGQLSSIGGEKPGRHIRKYKRLWRKSRGLGEEENGSMSR
jgi:hypothetical protein